MALVTDPKYQKQKKDGKCLVLGSNNTVYFLQHELQQILRSSGNLEQKMETFLATGNAPSNNVNLAQYKGLTIVAENINRMRYMSHFKLVTFRFFFVLLDFFFGPAGKIIRMPNPAHGVLNVRGRQCQTFTDIKPRLLLQLLLVLYPRFLI